MIVCHCNVLTDKAILATLADEPANAPRSPAQVYKCLGCAPNCGRCLVTVRKMLNDARAACSVGCTICPAGAVHAEAFENDQISVAIAAE